MSEFESGPRDLPWSKNAYLLLNAINLPQLRSKLFEWNPDPIYTMLFVQTRFRELLDHSPALIQINGPYDPAFSSFLTHTRDEWGLLLFSDADHTTVASHLRWLVFVDVPAGKSCHLNLSDPPVANACSAFTGCSALSSRFTQQTSLLNAGSITRVTVNRPFMTRKSCTG